MLDLTRQLSPSADGTGGGVLSEREQQVARLVVAGLTYRQIGTRLFISAKTVEHHVAPIRHKIGSRNRRDLLTALEELLADQNPDQSEHSGRPDDALIRGHAE